MWQNEVIVIVVNSGTASFESSDGGVRGGGRWATQALFSLSPLLREHMFHGCWSQESGCPP